MPLDKWALNSANSLYAFAVVGTIGAFIMVLFSTLILSVVSPAIALLGFVVAVAAQAFWRRKMHKANLKKGAELQKTLHNLKQADFELRYAEAQKAGQLDRFGKDK